MIQTYIGIDPDIEKSGVAVWSPIGRRLTVQTVAFPRLIHYLQNLPSLYGSALVVLEAGWLNKASNFHRWTGSPAVGERMAAKVGQNHAVGKLIEQFLQAYTIEYELVKPTTGKWDAETFKKITGLTQRTNSEMRDAAKLVYGR